MCVCAGMCWSLFVDLAACASFKIQAKGKFCLRSTHLLAESIELRKSYYLLSFFLDLNLREKIIHRLMALL